MQISAVARSILLVAFFAILLKMADYRLRRERGKKVALFSAQPALVTR
jgi:hypothetical protein